MAENSDLYPRSFRVSFSETASKSLVIPLCFMEFLADPLPKTVKLQGIGGKIWTVSMKKISGAVYFTTGWPKFAKDHELKNGEFMTFVYDGHHTFEVSVLERFGCKETRAEIQAIQLSDSDFAVEDKEDSSDDDDDDDDDVFAGNKNNPHFPYKLKNKNTILSIPAKVVKDNNLHFGSSIEYIDGQGTLVGKRSKWTDRIGFKKWDSICRRNKLKKHCDTVECELLHDDQKMVHSIRVHVPKKRTEEIENNAAVFAGNLDMESLINLHFPTKLKKRIYELLIPAQVVKDYYNLNFGSSIKYIDGQGTLVGQRAKFADKRISFKGWDIICKRNMLKKHCEAVCELLHDDQMVHSIRVHFPKKRELLK